MSWRLPDQIVCVDCGGLCHRISRPHDDGDRPGDSVVYRCEECLDRWDLVVDEGDEVDEGDDADGAPR